ncbi:MAG: ABC transporter substrate-binding protein [Pseudonocardia sp.]
MVSRPREQEVDGVRQARPGWWLVVVLVLVGLLGGCADALPPEAIPAAPPSPPPPVPTEQRQLVVAVDDLGPGFNPHLLSDLSPVSAAVASLVLPSVFRPGPDGAPVLDTTVASSAKVVSTAPFTVSYELSLTASWSDNTPIAAEDFVYLWERMRREPGVVDAAGYQLITDVRSRAGGKAVDVVFSRAYPQWQRLFSHLLPASLLKNAPRSWSSALAENIPVSGGPFQLTAVDRDRGQLVLSRNDHYWATPAVLDSLVLRRSDPTGTLDGLRSGSLPLALAWPNEAGLAALRQLATPGPGTPPTTPAAVRLQPVAQPMVVQLGLRTDAGVLADVRIRRAVAAMLDRDALIAVGTGNGAGGVRVDSQLLAPTTPGYRPTMPAGSPGRPDPELAEQLLTDAGYQRDAAGRWTLLGTPLRITIGTPAGRLRFAEVAEETRRQLAAAGVEAQVVSPPGSVLYTEPTLPPAPAPTGGVAGPSAPATAGPATPGPAGSPSATATPGPGPSPELPPVAATGPPTSSAGPSSSSAGPPSSSAGPPTSSAGPSSGVIEPAPAGTRVDLEVLPRQVGGDLAAEAVSSFGCPPGMAGVDQPARNATGFCSVELQPVLDAALSTGLTPEQAATAIDPVLWRQLPTIPLFQVVTTLASTPEGDRATGGIGPGPLLLGPIAAAPDWRPVAG